MKARRADLVEALNGRFDDHHGELARMLLDQIDALTTQIDILTGRIEELIGAMPATYGVNADGTTGLGAGTSADAAVVPAVARLDEIPGISPAGAQVILAEIGLDMTRFPTAGHLASWAKLSPRTIQSGATTRSGKTGKGNPYLKGLLGEAAAAAARTDTFLGERYRRLVTRIGKLKALVAVGDSRPARMLALLEDPGVEKVFAIQASKRTYPAKTSKAEASNGSAQPGGGLSSRSASRMFSSVWPG
jgi:transposase